MSKLKKRIVAAAPADDLRIIGTLNGPTQLPMTRMVIHPGTLGYADVQSLITSDGAQVIAMPPGGYGTLVRAGRP